MVRNYVDLLKGLVESGHYKTNSEVIRDGLRLLQEKQAASKLETLRKFIDEGENNGEPINWDVNEFLVRMKNNKNDQH